MVLNITFDLQDENAETIVAELHRFFTEMKVLESYTHWNSDLGMEEWSGKVRVWTLFVWNIQ